MDWIANNSAYSSVYSLNLSLSECLQHQRCLQHINRLIKPNTYHPNTSYPRAWYDLKILLKWLLAIRFGMHTLKRWIVLLVERQYVYCSN